MFDPWVGKILWRREWQSIPVLPGKSHGQRSLAGYNPGSQSQTGLSVLNWKFLITPAVLSRATSRGVCSMHGACAIRKIGAGRGSLYSSSLASCPQNLHFL